MRPNVFDRFLTGLAYGGVIALVLVGGVISFQLFHVSSLHQAIGLIGDWLAASFGIALAGGFLNVVRPLLTALVWWQ